ncbi:methyl-accepting chemotaxis protein (plasmid) [Agrobacterium salinitolerans]|uniref:Methyl-accepting chemotaxis protein n=1 Tax=Agrobacterium salinitolerans TaxID=1183413 RepID=A0A9X9KH27_9HYPH|nr:HAMP domain-containing methyl-accepting chemotaxis protein [Agrobacterium salinitolerans]UYZ10836.1 methyl-accepting chemotaxis protein [Agrobacterium salinitolerans]
MEHISIKTKMLLLVVPICAIGIAGLTFVSLKYRNASQSYVSFIAEDGAAAIHMARANQHFTAVSYNAYQILSYDIKDPNIKKFALFYENNKAKLVSELRLVKRLVPDQKTSIDRFIAAANDILLLTNQAVQFALKGDATAANASLRKADPLIASQVLAVRDWTDKFTQSVDMESSELAADADATSKYSLAIITLAFAAFLSASLFISSRFITIPIVKLRDRMIALAEGETSADIPSVQRRDELGNMARAVSVFRINAVERQRLEQEGEATRLSVEEGRRVQLERDTANASSTDFAVKTLGFALRRLADGDLLHRIETTFRHDLDALRFDYNTSVEKLLAALNCVSENARRIDHSCGEISSAADALASRAERQAASLEETASAIAQLTVTIKDSAGRASDAKTIVAQARSEAIASGDVVRSAIEAMRTIEKSSQEITSIIVVIDEIAFQTNLLALNAGVEASRAGEAGRGFAVVAQEVRELAQRSAGAAREIKELISSSATQVAKGVVLVGETGTTLNRIISGVAEIDVHVGAIAASAQEQSSTLHSINESVASIDHETQKNASIAEETAAAGAQLALDVEALTNLLTQFKIEAMTSADTNSDRDVPPLSQRIAG